MPQLESPYAHYRNLENFTLIDRLSRASPPLPGERVASRDRLEKLISK